LNVEQQFEIVVEYKGKEVGKHRLDLFVENTIVVVLKAVQNLEDIHFCHSTFSSESGWETAWLVVKLR
jgi:GxxExxY protein